MSSFTSLLSTDGLLLVLLPLSETDVLYSLWFRFYSANIYSTATDHHWLWLSLCPQNVPQSVRGAWQRIGVGLAVPTRFHRAQRCGGECGTLRLLSSELRSTRGLEGWIGVWLNVPWCYVCIEQKLYEGMSTNIGIRNKSRKDAWHLSPYPSSVLLNYFEYIDFHSPCWSDSGRNGRKQ